MSRTRVVFSLTGMLALLVAAGGVTVWSLPLRAEPVFAPAQADSSQPPQKVRVGGNVQQSKLIHQVRPQYPPVAKQARIQGTVRLEVLIAVDGAVKQVRLISAHPMLAGAVMEAVKKWRYRPTLLDGEPVEVVTQVEVRLPPGVVAPEAEVGQSYRVGEGVMRPVLIHKVEPVYTQEARDAKLEGKVVALVEVGADGVIRNVEIVKPLGMGLDEKAVEALRQWRFQPAEKDAQPVAVKATIEMNFWLY